MPLSLPSLDDLQWDDLLEEGRMLIPAWAPEWTDHNPSDPGITLMELFAYYSEKLMYQLNRVGDKNVLEFLQLINGPDWKQAGPLAAEKRAAVRELGELKRAVTAADFEKLTKAVAGVERAKCVARRNLESTDAGAAMTEAPGHISVVVVAKNRPHPSHELLASVKRALEPALLLTTRIHVVGPRFVKVKCRLTVVPRRGMPAEAAREAAIGRLEKFFDPLTGGLQGKGWPFGGNVYVSDLYRVLGEEREIGSAMPTRDMSGNALDELAVDAGESDRVRRNSRGEMEAVLLQADELVEMRTDQAEISGPPHV